MARLKIVYNGTRYPDFDEGAVVTIGASPQMTVVLTDPAAGEAGQSPVARYVATIYVRAREVVVLHEDKRNRDHGLWVVDRDGRRSTRVDYGCTARLHGRGALMIRDSPGQAIKDRYDDIHVGFSTVGTLDPAVRQIRQELELGLDSRQPTLDANGVAASFPLKPAEIDYVVSYALPWITGQPDLWLSKREITLAWGVSKNVVRYHMGNVRDLMAAWDPPLWDPANDERGGGEDEAAAALLAKYGVVGRDDLKHSRLLGWLRNGESPVRADRPKPQQPPG